MSPLQPLKWQFAPHHPMSKQRDPIQGEFFNTDSIKNSADEIVREAIQNSLDAATGAQVSVRIYISGELGAVEPNLAADYFRDLKLHAQACGAPTDLMSQRCKHLVIEDFGTTGLRGDVTSTEEPSAGDDNDFFYFFRAEGKSGKSGADRGRWGVGKYVFPKASQLNTFFGMTVRSPDSERPGPFLLGQAVMRNHKIGDAGYEPDGWWADVAEGVPIPTDNPDVIDGFRSTWHVMRKYEAGMSVVVPYADDSLTVDDIRRSVVRDYFVAILSGSLVVRIEAPDIEPIEVTVESLDSVVEDLADDEREQLLRNIRLVRWSLPEPSNLVVLEAVSGYPSWTTDSIEAETKARIRESLSEGALLAVRVPVSTVARDDSAARDSYFDVLFASEEGTRRLPMFVREGIIVSEAVQRGPLPGVRAIAVIPSGSLADLLGDAEGPAHTTWSEKTAKFRQKYVNGAAWLTFVKQSPRRILEISRGSDEEEDRSIAVDFFFLPDDLSSTSKGPTAESDKPGDKTRKPIVPVSRPRKINIQRAGDGFSVTLSEEGAGVKSVEVVVAYDRRGGSPFSRWTTDDFDLGSLPVDVSGGDLTSVRGNRLLVAVGDPALFKLKVRGFDTNRDLCVNAKEVGQSDAN